MDFRRKPGIFKELFNGLREYATSKIAFEYLEPVNEVNYVVDLILNIDPEKPGNYFVKDDLKIYDQDGLFLELPVVYTNILDRYFINEFNLLSPINEKYNNTLIGQYGIDINFGDLYEESTFTNPSFYFMYVKGENLNPLETDYNTIEKTLFFDIGVAINEGDLFDSNYGYDNYDFYTDFLFKLIFEYWDECPSVLEAAKRITYFNSDDYIIEEKRPLLRGLINNELTYR